MLNTVLPALRPMRMGELLDQSIRLYRKHFITFIGIIAIVYVPVSLIPLISSLLRNTAIVNTPAQPVDALFSPAYLATLGSSFLSLILNSIFVGGLGTAALTRAIADNYLGKPVGILESYKRVGKSWLILLVALLIAGLIYAGVVIFFIIPCVGWVTGPGLMIFLAMVVIPMIAPVVVMEKSGSTASLRRAWDLSRRRFWWLIGYRVILTLLSLVIVSGPVYLVSWLALLIGGKTGSVLGMLQMQTIVSTLTSLVTGLLYTPLQLTATTFAYFDIRVRTEGFDMALLTMEASNETGVEVVAQAPIMRETKRLLTWEDVGHFAIISIGIGVIYALLMAILLGIGLATQSTAGL